MLYLFLLYIIHTVYSVNVVSQVESEFILESERESFIEQVREVIETADERGLERESSQVLHSKHLDFLYWLCWTSCFNPHVYSDNYIVHHHMIENCKIHTRLALVPQTVSNPEEQMTAPYTPLQPGRTLQSSFKHYLLFSEKFI